MKYIIAIIAVCVWLYLLWVTDRASLPFWHFILGAIGLFLLMMFFVHPLLTEPLARAVAAVAGLVGKLTGTFSPFFKYGILFVQSAAGAITLQIDFECSGIIEIMVFLSMLVFFRVYTVAERVVVAICGVIYIVLANALRIIIICEMIHFGGLDLYYISHTLVGRLVFYALSVLLYFYVFTKPQIIRMKLGKFSYGNH